MLRPIAQSGQEPVYSMGDDAPIAPLAGRARPLASYFRQRFAQVTNPAIDHYRERTVMSVATLVGAAAAARGRGAAADRSSCCRRSSSPPPGSRRSSTRSSTRPSTAAEGLSAAVERVADAAAALVEAGAAAVCLSDATAGGERAAIPSLARRRRRPRPAHRAGPPHRLLAPRRERRGA